MSKNDETKQSTENYGKQDGQLNELLGKEERINDVTIDTSQCTVNATNKKKHKERAKGKVVHNKAET